MPEQQIREGMTWEPIEEAKAKGRLKLSPGQGIKGVKNFTPLNESGRVNDIIARRVGLGSGMTYEKGKAVVVKIDEALATGDLLQRGELLRMTLNEQSISTVGRRPSVAS